MRRTRAVKSDKPVIIGKLWAKWCPHCISLIPNWDKMKEIIQQKSRKQFEYMEIEENEIHKIDDFNAKHQGRLVIDKARGYPTIYKISGGKIEYYNGERDGEVMANWMMRIEGGKRKKLKSRKKRVKV
jgi:thiol-disulfide isomerase/thioredoxin